MWDIYICVCVCDMCVCVCVCFLELNLYGVVFSYLHIYMFISINRCKPYFFKEIRPSYLKIRIIHLKNRLKLPN